MTLVKIEDKLYLKYFIINFIYLELFKGDFFFTLYFPYSL